MTFTPRATSADRANAVHPLESARDIKTPLEGWRSRNPDHFRSWKTTTGCVVAFGGWKVFYGRCPGTEGDPCAALVTTRRRMREGYGREGRWPVYCQDCRKLREKLSAAGKAAERKRRQRQAERDTYERYGRPSGMTWGMWNEMLAKSKEIDSVEGWYCRGPSADDV